MLNKVETRTVLAAAVLALLAATLLILAFKPIPLANDNAFNLFLGALIGYGGAVVSFFFGSSKGSTAKDETIAALTK